MKPLFSSFAYVKLGSLHRRWTTFQLPLILYAGIIASSFLQACKPHSVAHVERAFYFWKNNASMTDNELKLLDSMQVKKLYVKLFEVNHSQERGNYPEAKFQEWYNYQVSQKTNQIIPTVYIRNSVFLHSSNKELDQLADNVNFLIHKMISEKFTDIAPIAEFQMDCDWTIKSKDNYFYFLTKLKQISGKKISCTLRLYPFAYPQKMGVPPVDKVSLMCYNLLNPLENKSKNSILDLSEFESYLKTADAYPLHLDIALPLYSWAQVYHNERFSEIIYSNYKDIASILKADKPMWYTVTTDTMINATYLRIGDKIKIEDNDAAKIRRAIEILKKYISLDDNTCITLFHLDEDQLKSYTHEEINSFYTDFSK
jgi:hypothetical protein